MLNINNEITYYKSKDFINYMYGCFKYADGHATYENMESYLASPWGLDKFSTDFTSVSERQELSDTVYHRIKEDDGAFNLFRCDFDFGITPIDTEKYADDYQDVLVILKHYCKEYDTFGITVTHFDQIKEDNEELILTRHVHIVYKEPAGAPSFTEYLQKVII